jgi:hypothetical protein
MERRPVFAEVLSSVQGIFLQQRIVFPTSKTVFNFKIMIITIFLKMRIFQWRQVRAFELVLRTYAADPYDYYKTDKTAIKMLLPISHVKIHEKFNNPIPMVCILNKIVHYSIKNNCLIVLIIRQTI